MPPHRAEYSPGASRLPPRRGHADAICFRYGESRSFGVFEVSGDFKPPKLPGAKAREGKSGPPGGRPLPDRRKRGLLDAANLARIHFGEAEALLAEILQRRSDEVEFPVVNDEEAIMERLVVVDGELRVLEHDGRHPNLRCHFGISSHSILRQTA